MPASRFDPRNEKLFSTLAQLEAATIEVLRAVIFDETFRVQGQGKGQGLSAKGVADRLRRLMRGGYINAESLGLPPSRGRHILYRLSESGRHVYPMVATLGTKAKPLSKQRLQRAWVRGSIWKSIAQRKSSGLVISQTTELRQELSQHLKTIAPTGALPFDILRVKREGKPTQWFLIVVDDGETPVDDLVAALPLHDSSGPRVDVCLRPIDDGSLWDAAAHQFVEGRRLKALRLLCESTPQYRPWAPQLLRGVGVLRASASATVDRTSGT